MLGFVAQDTKKANRYYLRFHQTIARALLFHKEVCGETKGKDNKELKSDHAIRVAGMTQEIQSISIQGYHVNWLIGILHDDKQDNPVLYGEKIDQVLIDLLEEQQQLIKEYLNQLSSDKGLSKGEQKRNQVTMVQKMDLIPSYIKIFDKYDNCRRFINNSVGKNQKELNGYFAVALLCYDIAIKNHLEIKQNLNKEVKNFFQGLRVRLGPPKKVQEHAQFYYNNL